MLCELYFNKREGKKIERKRGTAGATEASGKAGQVSQMTLGPVDLKGSTESDVKVKNKKASKSVFLLPAIFADTTFQHSLFSTLLL